MFYGNRSPEHVTIDEFLENANNLVKNILFITLLVHQRIFLELFFFVLYIGIMILFWRLYITRVRALDIMSYISSTKHNISRFFLQIHLSFLSQAYELKGR